MNHHTPETPHRPLLSERLSAPLEIPPRHRCDAAHPWVVTSVQSESPFHRAGLLQAYGSFASGASTPRHTLAPHAQNAIRASTMQLSSLVIHPPTTPLDPEPAEEDNVSPSSTADVPPSTPPPLPLIAKITAKASPTSPSGLSLLIAREREAGAKPGSFPAIQSLIDSSSRDPHLGFHPDTPRSASVIDLSHAYPSEGPPSEVTPLLVRPDGNSYIPTHFVPAGPRQSLAGRMYGFLSGARKPRNIRHGVTLAIQSIPAVMVGCLLNILDGVSYGMIMFPAAGVFAGLSLGPMGVSMFFVSTLIAQMVYTFGGSQFAGANGSMMIEVVPFFHMIAMKIMQEIGEDKPQEIVTTTLFAFAFSSVLTGFAFFVLGALKLGNVVGFFPRHILVGCIGGIGAFLVETGLTVSTRMDDDEFNFLSLESLKAMFLDKENVILWSIPLTLAVILRCITHKFHHQLVFPLYFVAIFVVFYIVVFGAGLDLGVLREKRWLFDMGETHEAWYRYYSYFDVKALRIGPLLSTLPTQFALLFFNILHPPLNVPALSISLGVEVDTNKELVAHGYSNLLAGMLGTFPNYLVYVNTLLFYRVGGTTRVAGFLLAAATVPLLVVGTEFIAFIPIMVVGALIFVLGIDLVKEAIWDTRHRVTRMEYFTIWSIMICMTVWDFVVGVVFGIIVTCFFFVVQNSQRSSIRAFHTGETAMSTVRRPASQRAYLHEASKQTLIVRLQGYLFFGTSALVEETLRDAIAGPAWHRNPVRFLVLDLTHVVGVDMSSAEAIVRVQRLLSAKRVVLVLCGASAESPVAKSLESVEVVGSEGVELFSTFNDAMEWIENAYLQAWFSSQKLEMVPVALPGRQDADISLLSTASSPRRSYLHDAGSRTIANDLFTQMKLPQAVEPFATFTKTFAAHDDLDFEVFQPLLSLLVRVSAPKGHVLWRKGDESDGLYLVESGILRASYQFADYAPPAEESMVPGTLAGELTALSGLPRNATVVVEKPCVAWKLTVQCLRQLERENPVLAAMFIRLVLKSAKTDFDMLLSAVATRR